MRILILGATGMLGSAVFKFFSQSSSHDVWATIRSSSSKYYFDSELHQNLIAGVDALDYDSLASLLERTRPEVVINCIGLIKQLSDAKDPLSALPINSILPHRLAKLCSLAGARLVLISTDCVFSGKKGMYVETDVSDAEDLYGKSKYIGEVHDKGHVVTLRTSIIGHELDSCASLIDWFLSQTGTVKGYSKAIFSGVPTVELARIIKDFVIVNTELSGLYHVSAEPIDKFSLLNVVSTIYDKDIVIVPDDKLVIDRSLDSNAFRLKTGYVPPSWTQLIQTMHNQR